MTIPVNQQAVQMVERGEWGEFTTLCSQNEKDETFLPQLFVLVMQPDWLKANPNGVEGLLGRAELKGHTHYKRFSEMALENLPIEKVKNEVFDQACASRDKELAIRVIDFTKKKGKESPKHLEHHFVEKACQHGWKDLADGILAKKVSIFKSTDKGVQKLWDEKFTNEKKEWLKFLLRDGQLHVFTKENVARNVPKDVDWVAVAKDAGREGHAFFLYDFKTAGHENYVYLTNLNKSEGIGEVIHKSDTSLPQKIRDRIPQLIKDGDVATLAEWNKKNVLPADVDCIEEALKASKPDVARKLYDAGVRGSDQYFLLLTTGGSSPQLIHRSSPNNQYVQRILNDNIEALKGSQNSFPGNIDWVGAALELGKGDVAIALHKAKFPGSDRYVQLTQKTGASYELYPKKPSSNGQPQYTKGLDVEKSGLVYVVNNGWFSTLQTMEGNQNLDWVGLAKQLDKDALAKQLFDGGYPGYQLHRGEF